LLANPTRKVLLEEGAYHAKNPSASLQRKTLTHSSSSTSPSNSYCIAGIVLGILVFINLYFVEAA
jgi:hypothetical protein